MLILTRKKNEAIQIGDHIEIKVLSVEGEQVKIGIEAPRDVDIHRKEVYLNIKSENDQASLLPGNLLDTITKNKE